MVYSEEFFLKRSKNVCASAHFVYRSESKWHIKRKRKIECSGIDAYEEWVKNEWRNSWWIWIECESERPVKKKYLQVV